jgi:hypothetical protein
MVGWWDRLLPNLSNYVNFGISRSCMALSKEKEVVLSIVLALHYSASTTLLC